MSFGAQARPGFRIRAKRLGDSAPAL